jgi:hypothetical protein
MVHVGGDRTCKPVGPWQSGTVLPLIDYVPKVYVGPKNSKNITRTQLGLPNHYVPGMPTAATHITPNPSMRVMYSPCILHCSGAHHSLPIYADSGAVTAPAQQLHPS